MDLPRPDRHPGLALLVACALAFPVLLLDAACPSCALAWSSGQPPRTGLEPPDQPHKMRSMPGMGALRDAYGNSILDDEVPEKKPHKRLPPGAYGTYGKKHETRPLPPDKDETPLW